MKEQSSSYKQIFKATSIFGGVQVFNIIIQLVRSKVVAILLGPTGMGIIGLFQTTISLITSATSFGLGTSAVKEVSEVSNNEQDLSYKIAIFRKLVWFTGFLGMAVMILFSPILSKFTFGNNQYTLSLIFLAVTLLFTQLSSGQLVILQGLRKLTWLAKANIYASLIGLFTTIPIYYFFGLDGIVFSLIITSVVGFLINYFFAKKLKFKKISVTFKESLLKGKEMLKLGFVMNISAIIAVLGSYIMRVFISKYGGVEQVGLYTAGFSIINSYVGLVFSAMVTDYFPRLSSVNKNQKECNTLIQHQSEVALFILAPLLCVFLIFIDEITLLLYTDEFLPITIMMRWAVLGIFFKAVSWSIGFLTLAKGDAKAFFWNELIANFNLVFLNIIGYYYWKLEGLGISFLLSYFIYLTQIFIFSRKFYNFRLPFSFFKSFFFLFTFGIICFLISLFTSSWIKYALGIICIIVCTMFSIKFLNEKTQFLDLLKKKLKSK